MAKFRRIVQEKYETEAQSELYSYNDPGDLIVFVQNRLKKRALSEEDKQRIIDLMESYGRRMFYVGKRAGIEEAEKDTRRPSTFNEDMVIYDVKEKNR